MITYKVVTKNMKSLGLRNNPNIIQYPINQWVYLKKEDLQEGARDWGGIWVAKTLSGAKKLRNYMAKKYSHQTRIFKSDIDKILYANSYRIKTNGIKLLEEIF